MQKEKHKWAIMDDKLFTYEKNIGTKNEKNMFQ